MSKWIMIMLLFVAYSTATLRAQRIRYTNDEGVEVLPVQIDPRTGDSIPVIRLQNTFIFNKKKFKSNKQEANYWRMVNDVRKTLPIAKEAKRLLVVAYDTCQTMSSREQRKYFKALEIQLWDKYKPQLKKFNYRQGKLLVRLIDRECDKASYQLIKEFLGGVRAVFWQGFGKLFGVSLKSEWDPDGKDKELEDICLQIEQGML